MKKFFNNIKKIKKNVIRYISTNRLFTMFVFLCIVDGFFVRKFTVGNAFGIEPIIVDLAMALLIGGLGYLLRVKRQYLYFNIWLWIITIICIVNTIYYVFYLSFASFGMLSSLLQVGEVGDSVLEKLELYQFIYLLGPIIFYILNKTLKKKNYYTFVGKVEQGKKMFISTMLVAVLFVCLTLTTMTSADYSRISKQWNREYLVEKFGIIFYQSNDFVQSLTPKIGSLFGYDEAAKTFREFYNQNDSVNATNKYTNIYEGKNLVFVHMESIQNFVLDLNINGQDVAPNIKELSKEGMYFDKFYPQISVGTSSDTEFTLLTSLMPALSGTVFVSYYDREFLTIPDLLKEKGYYTFSMHGNNATMWNRKVMHAKLGYDRFYSKNDFVIDDTVGLGLSDVSFFEQVKGKLEAIESENEKYMGTIISLSNHSPFDDLEHYGEFDITATIKNEEGIDTKVNYLEGTKIGNYIHSVHYADAALGSFMDYVKNSSYYDNTVFVFYGDHEARLSKSEFDYLYNFDTTTGELLTVDDENYVDYDYYANELNKNTPLIIWTKNGKYKQTVDYTMGMYDILPTLGNMFGFKSQYALGTDIFNSKNNNVVIFPNGNFLTDKVYYNNTKEEYIVFGSDPIDSNYIDFYKDYSSKRLEVSNDIIVYDLIKKEKDSLNSYSEPAN